jgi:hypothetical protein
VEEEEFSPDKTVKLPGTSLRPPKLAPPIAMSPPPARSYKACDIHINIGLGGTPASALRFVEALELASFDKPEADGIHRIFSATCESFDSGQSLFEALKSYLSCVPELVGKMKFERTTRFIRVPVDAPALPLISDQTMAAWLEEIREQVPSR